MVRYPKKTTPYVPIPTTLHQSEPENADIIPSPDVSFSEESLQEFPVDTPVEVAQARHDATSKLTSAKKTFNVSLWKKFLPVIVVTVIILLIVFFIVMKPRNFPYAATIGIVIQPDNRAFSNSHLTDINDVQRSLKLTDHILGKVWMQLSGLPAIWQQQQWLANLTGKFLHNRIALTKHPNQWGIIVQVKDDHKERAGQMATALVQEFEANYLQKRKIELKSALTEIKVKIKIEEKRMNELLLMMESYVQAERGIVVSSGVMKALEVVMLQQNSLLEQEYERLKVDSEIFPIASLSKEKEFDWVSFQGLYSRLIDLELMKYAVTRDSRNMFDGGIQLIKSKIAQMIQQLTERKSTLDPNLIIKAVFVNAKLEAVDVLKSKRMGIMDSFQGRRLEYIRLRLEYDQKFMMLENLNVQRNKIEDLLKSDLSNEMKIDMPLTVIKR